MLGAVSDDIVGSVYEHLPIKTKDFQLFSDESTFTDDTVMTVAIAHALLNNREFAGQAPKGLQNSKMCATFTSIRD